MHCLLIACTDALRAVTSRFAEPDLSGSLRVPLTAEDASGIVYRLRNVDLEVTGSALLSLSDRDGVRARESLFTQLPAGEYTVFLRPGWRLMARNQDGQRATRRSRVAVRQSLYRASQRAGRRDAGARVQARTDQLSFGSGSPALTCVTSLRARANHATRAPESRATRF